MTATLAFMSVFWLQFRLERAGRLPIITVRENLFWKRREIDHFRGIAKLIYRSLKEVHRMCGKCEFCRRVDGEWRCDNDESENYGMEVEYDYDCVDFMERDE